MLDKAISKIDLITLDWCTPQETITNSRIEIRNAFGLLIQTLVINNSCSQTVLPVENWKYGNGVVGIDGEALHNINIVTYPKDRQILHCNPVPDGI